MQQTTALGPYAVLCIGTLYQWHRVSLPDFANKFSPQKFTCAQIRTLTDLEIISSIDWSLISTDEAKAMQAESPYMTVWIPIARRIAKELSARGHIRFRGIIQLLTESTELRNALELKAVPNYSTLYRARNLNI